MNKSNIQTAQQLETIKMSRLDELLSRNEVIYQNLKSKLQDINRSNMNIDANLNTIKPMSVGSEYDLHQHDPKQDSSYNQNSRHNSRSRNNESFNHYQRENAMGYEQAKGNRREYNYKNEVESSPIQSQYHHTVSNEREQLKHRNNRVYMTNSREQNQSANIYQQQTFEEENIDYMMREDMKNPVKGRFAQKIQEEEEDKQWEGEKQVHNQISYIFIPFNKLYSSPILQLSKSNELTIARVSKAQSSFLEPRRTGNGKILNGIKYKFVRVIVEQEQVYKQIYCSYYSEMMANRDSCNYIGIVGGRNSLKKKIHFGILAHAYSEIVSIIKDEEMPSLLKISMEHQQAATDATPILSTYEFQLTESHVENSLIVSNLSALLEKIFMDMKSRLVGQVFSPQSHRIRVTKINVYKENLTVVNLKVMSTNKVDAEFIGNLGLHKIIWCVNPLFKYYEGAAKTLEHEKIFRSHFCTRE